MTKTTVVQTMPRCPICYNLVFKNYVEFHDHYVSNHSETSDYSHNHMAEIRMKAIATPLNISGRTKKQIVEWAETSTSLKDILL